MSHLLHVTRLSSPATQRPGVQPLMVEFTVPEETAPYLVSSSSSVLWVNQTYGPSLIKAAVRSVSLGAFFREVLDAVVVMGRQQEWGNVHPLTVAGLRAAVDHVASYELAPLELLIPRAHPPGSSGGAVDGDSKATLITPELRPLIEEVGLPFRPSVWVPDGTIVVVPKDRTYVGVAYQVAGRQTAPIVEADGSTPKPPPVVPTEAVVKIAAAVHNAARGVAVVQKVFPC